MVVVALFGADVAATLLLGLARFRGPLFRETLKAPRVFPSKLPTPSKTEKVVSLDLVLVAFTFGTLNSHWITLPCTEPRISVTLLSVGVGAVSVLLLFLCVVRKKNDPLLELFLAQMKSMVVPSDAFTVSPSATYPEESPLSSMDSSVPLGATELLVFTDPNRQLVFPAGSQLSGVSKHTLVTPQPVRVMFTSVLLANDK